MKKLILEVSCERNRFRYGNLCKYLPNFLNLAALLCSIDFNEWIYYTPKWDTIWKHVQFTTKSK